MKKQYRMKTLAYHPDKNDGDGTKMAELNVAYQPLTDKEQRDHYEKSSGYLLADSELMK